MNNRIYKGIAILVSLASTCLSLQAQQVLLLQRTENTYFREACGIPVDDVMMERNGGLMSVRLRLDLSEYELKGNRASVFTPVLSNGRDSVEFDPVGLYSKTRYIQYLRSGEKPLGGNDEKSYLHSERPSTIEYDKTIAYADWMNGASLYLRRNDYGCCRTLIDGDETSLAGWHEKEYRPAYYYVSPVAEGVKLRELSGSAFIDFPVNRTEIRTDYRKNTTELAKIIATIDSVRNDKDVTIKRITIKGYASPEGTYDNNTRLAKGRTEALKQYVSGLYHFAGDFISTDYEPEDWDGLREYVEGSTLEHRTEMLAIIDSDLAPDPKEWKIKSTYPEEYQFLLQTVYPGLRHSDYTIEYTIRSFSDVKEILETLNSAPQKLSLNEMYVLAQSMEAGSDEYNNVFETAVRMYPGDETANLNAANSAMQRNDFVSAEKYLAKAGDRAEAVYARGIYALLTGDYALAKELISVSGLSETGSVLEYIDEIVK